jgi:predicted kinase
MAGHQRSIRSTGPPGLVGHGIILVMSSVAIVDPCLVVLVGPAGAGKSTLASRHFAPDEVLSSDGLRAVVSGDPADQSASGAAFAILHRELAKRLAAGRLTVVDATNLRAEHRRPLLARAAAATVPAAAIVLDLPPDVVRARNRGRSRVVDDDVVERQLGWLRLTVDGGRLEVEGFGPIVVIRSVEALDRLEVTRLPVTPLA